MFWMDTRSNHLSCVCVSVSVSVSVCLCECVRCGQWCVALLWFRKCSPKKLQPNQPRCGEDTVKTLWWISMHLYIHLCIWNTCNSWLAPSRVGGIDAENFKHQWNHPLGLSLGCIRCEQVWRKSCFLNCSRICTTWGNTKMSVYKVGSPMDTILDNWQLSFNVCQESQVFHRYGHKVIPSYRGRTKPCLTFVWSFLFRLKPLAFVGTDLT